jgi:hypothetical protein
VFTARYALSPYIKQIRFVFNGLMDIYDTWFVSTYRFWLNRTKIAEALLEVWTRLFAQLKHNSDYISERKILWKEKHVTEEWHAFLSLQAHISSLILRFDILFKNKIFIITGNSTPTSNIITLCLHLLTFFICRFPCRIWTFYKASSV